MPVSKIHFFTTFGFLIFIVSTTAVPASSQGVRSGPIMCACPKPIPHKPLGSAANCEEACYGRRDGGNSSSSNAAEAARLAREREEREKAEREAAEAEQKRLDEEKRLKAEEAQRAFINGRDEDAKSLRGSIGTSSGANSSSGPELRGSGSDKQGDLSLRGSRTDLGIRTGEVKKVVRDFSGPNSAWKELFCAASILGPAVGSLNIDGQGSVRADYSGFKSLALEAINALNGEVKGVPCSKAPDLPGSVGGSISPEKMIESGKRLITKTIDLAAKLENARAQMTAAETEMKKPASPASPVGGDDSIQARQRAINKRRDEEATRIAEAQRNFKAGAKTEAETKVALIKIVDAIKKVEENPEDIGVIFDEAAPQATTPKTALPKTSVRRPVRH